MTDMPTILWPGKSGTRYKYWIYRIGTSFTEAPGNYIFAQESEPGTFRPIYIGQTSDLSMRLGNHEKEECAKRNGATHIQVHLTPTGEKARLAEEKDLILRWQPVCNEQYVY